MPIRREGTNVGRQGVFKLEKLWAFSKEPLKQPLMKTLVRNSSLSSLACNAFTDILQKHSRLSILAYIAITIFRETKQEHLKGSVDMNCD